MVDTKLDYFPIALHGIMLYKLQQIVHFEIICQLLGCPECMIKANIKSTNIDIILANEQMTVASCSLYLKNHMHMQWKYIWQDILKGDTNCGMQNILKSIQIEILELHQNEFQADTLH